MDKLRVLQFFLAAADHGSFAAVAKNLGASPSTISKAMSRLEDDLGIQLFYRNTRRLTLTQGGHVYAETVRKITDELSACEHSIKHVNDEARGHLKISLPVSYGRLYVRPWMKQFNELYPDITFELSYSDHYIDLIEQGIDICIRSGTIQDNRLTARKLSPIDFVTCASTEYLKKHPNLQEPIDTAKKFSQHKCIQFRFGQTGKIMPYKFYKDGVLQDYFSENSLIVDDGEAMSELCADSFGITQMPHFIARNWLKSGALQMVGPTVRIENFGVYVLYPKRHYLPNRVRVFIDFLIEQLSLIGEFSDRTWAL